MPLRYGSKERLTKEINTWDHRAEQLKLQEQGGQSGARLNSREARRRADHLQARFKNRLETLTREAQLSPLPPVVQGAAPAPAVSTADTQAAATLSVTRNEILYSLNRPEDYILGIVEFLDDGEHRVRYVREPFQREPDFGATSVNYDFAQLLARGEAPG